MKKWGGKREDVFICSKWGWSDPDGEHDPEMELKQSLERIGVEDLDLCEWQLLAAALGQVG